MKYYGHNVGHLDRHYAFCFFGSGNRKHPGFMSCCSLMRRAGAIFYDTLLLLSVLFFATLIILPFTGGQAISGGNIPYYIYLVIISYLYFTWQWTHGGQTLGMRAWNVRMTQSEKFNVSWWNATLRFFLAIISWTGLGLGFVWIFFDRDRMAFHDRFSNTLIIKEQKPGN